MSGRTSLILRARDPQKFFFEELGIERRWLEEGVGGALRRRCDDADLYFEFRCLEAVSLEDGLVKSATRSVSQGVGARVVVGDKTGYAHTDDVTLESLRLAIRTAEAIAWQGGEEQSVAVRFERPRHDLYPLQQAPIEVPPDEKVRMLARVDEYARRFDHRIRNVLASIVVEHKVILIARADGLVVGDVQPLVRMQVTCIAEESGNRQQGSYGGGGRVEFEYLLENDRYLSFTRKAAEQAIRNLGAVDAPAGEMIVVLGPGWPGILLHEAVGHGLEGDFNRKGVSAFAGRLGQVVASPLCTVVDDGTIPNRRGSLNVDDEGTPTGRTVLIEKGVLTGYLQDRLNARLMGMRPTGNGRRESFAHPPMPRMTNTFLLPGEHDPEEIIRSVDRGLYAVYFGGGQVDITNGKFVFSASEAYLIEGGKVTRPVKGATLIGDGPEVLKRITMVGHDLALDEGIGTCGKDGQSVPVGVGLPTVRIDGLTVGGTKPQG
ncbi:MAG: metalloprotease TldD [Candidatus Binatia bacterium]|nr:metalloprotease TldD [Candidatus Binatia bacterium]